MCPRCSEESGQYQGRPDRRWGTFRAGYVSTGRGAEEQAVLEFPAFSGHLMRADCVILLIRHPQDMGQMLLRIFHIEDRFKKAASWAYEAPDWAQDKKPEK